MNKPIGFCPHCKGGRELDLSLGLITSNRPEKSEDILLFHYHCAACNTYVRTTTIDNKEHFETNKFALVSNR